MKWGIALNVRDTISKTVDKSIIADRGGIDQIWVTDFPALRYAPAVATAVAEKTSDCRIGVGLMSPLLYSSSHIVQFMTTLVKTHGERFDLLLGPGDQHALKSIGITVSPKVIPERMKEALSEIKNGVSEVGFDAQVLIGAQGPKMIEASLESDGVLLNYTDLEMAKWAANQIKNGLSDFRLGIFPPAFIGPCEKFSDNLLISHSAAMVALGLGRTMADKFGLSESLSEARSLFTQKGKIDSEILSVLKDDLLKRFAFCGTVDQLQEYVSKLNLLGYTEVVFGPPIGLSREGVENLVSAKATS